VITTVLLDLDDTILADDVATDAAFMATARHAQAIAGIDPYELVTYARESARREWEKGPFPEWLDGIGTSGIEGLRAEFAGEDEHWAIMRGFGPGFRRRTWQQALEAMGAGDTALAATLDTMFARERSETNPWCPGADEALALLDKRYRLGMVTNGIPDVQRTKINATGLTDRFDAIVVSGELAVGKPDPAIYRHALQLLDASPEETIMVGDSFARDVVGAQAMGIRAVWISMGRLQPDHAEPWMLIESLAELPVILSECEESPGGAGPM
jgi:putative hydrolase of the HAD superfamily